ncbi:serine-protein kinase ATM-like [Amphibalanus amphitrite]|uniref:serine-protein kinase ATM-like n=1 Tax=Amphibalanus amphitrite TaxID=1232801 RepID=UPI001C91A0A3|nr:serine-protein kinase ATM-like [Amphibalanus amphitrite]
MAAALETLRDCCRTVAGDRLRDRRESADQLRQLIADNAALCAELDDAGRDRDRLNWTYVWEHVVIHFQKEMDKAEEDARRGKNVTQRELVPRQAVSLLRAVAHRANRGRARLEATQLAGTLLAALRHPFRRTAAGPELCAMLSAALLEPALVRAELSLVGWRDLLSGVISLLAEPPHRLQTHTLRSLLSLTAELGCQQTALLARVRGLLPLLDADGLLRDSPPITLRLVNVVLRLTAASGRRAVCRVGERLFTSVCQLADARHQCQEQVLAFLRLQVCARAPLCLRMAPAEETWARQLRKMYQVVVDEVESRCLRSRMVGRAAPLTTPLSDDWVRLFADVAYLLFERDEDTVLDVTLLPSLSTDGRPAKRRRLEVGVRAVCERIYETRASTECVPWLQLLTALIGAHPDALSAAQLPPCLSLLVSLLAAGSRLPEVRVPDRQADDVTAAWARIWELAVQASSLVQRQDASHALLQALLRRRAARPGRSFLALYLQREAVPAAVTPPLVVTLLEYLRRFAVPQPPGPAADPTETRCRLAQWLLESGCEPRASAEALIRLALRDNAADLGSLVEWCSNETAAGTDWYTDLGELYVCSELEEPLRVADSPPTPPAAPPTDVGEASVAPLKTKILSELTALVTAAERRNDDPSAGDAAVPRWCRAACDTAVLAASTLRFAGDCGLLSADELRHSPLVASLRSLLTTLLRTAAGELSAPPTADLNAHLTLLSLLTGLRALFETAEAPPVGSPHQAAAGRRALGSLLRSATPRVFTQEALRLLRDEASRLLPQSRRASHSDPLSDSSGESPLDSEFSEAECSSAQEPGRDSVLDIALHELEEVRLEACRLLVSFANVDAGEDVIAGSETSEELLSDVFMALLENRLDVRYPGDMRIALELLRKLPSSSALCTTHVVSLSELLQAVCRAWPRDVAVNLAVLDAMAGGYVQAVARRGCDKDRADAMKFVTVMVRKAETARFGERCLLSLLRLLAALAEQDPCGRWAVVDGRWAARPLLTHLSAPAEPNERGAGAWSTHRSRLLATRLLESVFAARERQPAVEGAAPSVQEMFELIYPSVIESMAQTTEQAAEWTRPDDAPNRAATLCLALCRVALGSSQCRPQALLALCQASRLRDVSPELVLRALRHLATALGLASPRRLLEAHLDFIVSQWLAERLTVLEFPHQLLEFASAKEFVREELGCVVPHLLGRHQDQLAAVAQLLEQQPAELVLSCVPQIVAQVVPGLAGSDGAALATAQRLYSRARQLVGGSETFDRALAAQTVEVLAALFRAHGAKPECIVPALQFAADKMYGSSLVVSLRRPAEDGLQRLLLLLATDVSAAAGSADRLAATRRYCALLDLLADDFTHLEELRPFVMLDVPSFVSHQLAALCLPAEAAAAERWAAALGRLGRVCAEQAPDALAPALELLCSALVGLHEACTGDECAPARDSAAGTLRLLLGPLSDGYRAAAEALTCLPVDGPLGGLTLAPAGGVLRTLSVGGALNVHALRAALEQVETPGSAAAADCSDALLARLLRLAAGEGGELRRAAARLLGAVGPRRLEGATLRVSPPAWQRTDAVGEEELRDVHLLERLHQLLTDRDVSVVSAAGTALRAVLASPAATRWQELLAVERPSFASELLPFYMTRQPLTPERLLTASEALRRLDSATLWVPEHGQYELWLTDVTLALLEAGARSTPSLAALAPLCSVKGAEFCRDVLPYATYAALLSDTHVRGVLSRWFNRLLQEHRSMQRRESSAVASTPTPSAAPGRAPLAAQPLCLQALLDVVMYLRRQPLPAGGRGDSPWERNFWLQLQLPAAAGAALRCGRYCEALLLAEVCCYAQHQDDAPLLARSADGDELRSLLCEAHVQLGDTDGVAALRTGGGDSLTQAVYLEQEGEWLRALTAYDALATERTTVARRGLLRCLAELQLLGSSQTLLRGLTAELGATDAVPSYLLEASCEAAWRLADWSAPCPPPTAAATPGLQQALFSCLSAYRDGDVAAAAEAVERGRTAALSVLAGSATPSTHVAGLCLSRLRLLWRADQLCQAAGGSPAELSALCDRWRHAPAPRLPFRLEEPQLSFSASLLAVLAERQPTLQDAVLLRQETLLRLSEGARAAGRLAAAERAAAALPADSVPSIRCRAENSWARSDAESALWLCRGLLDEGTREQQPAGRRLQLAQLKVLYAGWLSEVHREGPQEILEQHLEPAIVQLEQMTDGPDSERALLEAHYLAGQYADAQFQRIDEWVTSADFAAKRAEAIRMRQEADQFRKRAAAAKTDTDTKDFHRQHFNLTRSAELDEAELRQAEDDRTAFQRRAVASYLRCLQLGRHRDLLVYRLVALWLADTSGQVCELLRPAAPRLPAFKLVPLLYQLAARLGRPGWLPESAQLLEELLERCAAEHPHHTLPVLLALKNAHADAAGGAAPATDAGGEARTAAATRLVKRLASKPALAEPVRQLEAASAALVELAYHTHVGTASSGRVPSGCRLLKLGELSAVAVQTVPLPVRADADYTAVPTVIKWDNKYDMVGGVNAPKKLRCLGSDGRWRPQLLKGRDDLRQDAVMQQVFSVLNLLLAESAAPDQPPLTIRTYKVVPLSQRSGLIEWCVDTQPLADYLADKRGGAHVRYRPDDMTPAEARRAMQTVAKKSADQKRRAFAEVCRRLKPVMRHFFFERFPEPCAWYERRVAYTNSVAASSISGYVLGLGDRHVSNILIDKASAEVVHIDLGVAFETGRLLPTPETVPFRLTRDIVDGMGVAGVEGRFRRSCERTLSVLRESVQVVLTIVRVLLDDPLYAWTLTPDKVNRLQQRDAHRSAVAAGDNRQAERALARLAEKLRGQEAGQVMTCAAQVSHLIQQARDPENLCRLFNGWQAYL